LQQLDIKSEKISALEELNHNARDEIAVTK